MSRPFSEPDVFSAIADSTRRAILLSLAEGEKPVNELARPFRMSLPAVSRHLKVLRTTGLVNQTKVGCSQVYRINPEALKPVARWIAQYERFWRARLDALDGELEERG